MITLIILVSIFMYVMLGIVSGAVTAAIESKTNKKHRANIMSTGMAGVFWPLLIVFVICYFIFKAAWKSVLRPFVKLGPYIIQKLNPQFNGWY